MAITVRLRGKVWHARGTVRVGKEIIPVTEFSTGETTRAAAIEAGEREGRRIREETLDGSLGRARRLTVGDCLEAYESRPGGLKRYDEDRVTQLNDILGHRAIVDAPAGWQDWIAAHPDASPATVQRWRTILAAALKMGCAVHDVQPPKLPSVRQSREVRVVYLSPDERSRLLAAYSPHAACVVLLLAYQGMRTQEVLRLDWRSVDLVRETLHVRSDETKTGRGRTVPMHAKVAYLLHGMRGSAGPTATGPVFKSSRGEPYRDTRGVGGNPLKKMHDHACAAAGVTEFRIHDWRHDWAARCVMSGMDLYTLMRLGGWQSLRMVERYASVTAEHARDAMRRIA